MTDYHESNRHSWNAATEQHHTHRADMLERYRDGWNNLYLEEMDLLGDLTGKRAVHLQCNDGQDTVSMARHLGADVTGVDISDTAIEAARKLAEAAGVEATFVRDDIFHWCETTDERFDVVYTGYGALCWLSDIDRWGRCVERVLKPDSRLVLIDFHPTMNMFDLDWTIDFDGMGGRVIETGGVGDYVGDDYEGEFKNPHNSYEFAWGLGEIVTALLNAGLTLTHLKEYPYITGWKRFPEMRTEVDEHGRSRHYLPEEKPVMPMMFSVVAAK